jgi:DNA-binding NarL/FixJ family response regulator
MKSIKVCIVAPFEPLRIGLVREIDEAPDMEVVGQAHDLTDLASLAAFREADVLVVDSVAVLGTRRVTYDQINDWLPMLKVLFLGTEEDARNITPDDIPAYMRLHTVGFLLKDGPTSRMMEAIRLVAGGTFVCETSLIRHILVRLSQAAAYSAEEHTNGQSLSDREMEVLRLVTRGMSNKEIAQDLFLSEGTVKAHVSHIMGKLSVERRTDLVRHALTTGLVPLEGDSGETNGAHGA